MPGVTFISDVTLAPKPGRPDEDVAPLPPLTVKIACVTFEGTVQELTTPVEKVGELSGLPTPTNIFPFQIILLIIVLLVEVLGDQVIPSVEVLKRDILLVLVPVAIHFRPFHATDLPIVIVLPLIIPGLQVIPLLIEYANTLVVIGVNA